MRNRYIQTQKKKKKKKKKKDIKKEKGVGLKNPSQPSGLHFHSFQQPEREKIEKEGERRELGASLELEAKNPKPFSCSHETCMDFSCLVVISEVVLCECV